MLQVHERKLTVAVYCRVSTDKSDQLNSLENQRNFFREYIDKNLNWKFYKIFVDEGLSGTSVKKRAGFLQMVKEAAEQPRKFDLIVTKEISRFSRNTLDSIYYVRKLKEYGVGVFFLNDNINTLDPDSELRLTIMSSIAQEESRKISERVKFGQKRQMQDKKVVFGTGVYGFHLEKGRLTVNHSEADVVRLIFDLYMKEGMGSNLICRELKNRGIPSPSGSPNWVAKTVLYILKNEKYTGVLLQKKSITTNYLTHKRIANDGIEDFIMSESNHEAIISRELFDETQKEIISRRNSEPNKAKYGNRYVWSGKLVCGTCGNKFIRKLWYCKTKYEKSVWQCNEQRKNGNKKVDEQRRERGCNCPAAFEEVLTDAVQLALQLVTKNKTKIISELKQDIMQVLSKKPDNTETINALEQKIKAVHNKKSKLIELFTDSTITRAEFDVKNEQYKNAVKTYISELADLEARGEATKDLQERFNTIGKAVEKISEFGEFSEEVCRECLQKIVVHNREQLDVYLAGNLDSPLYYEVIRFDQSLTRNKPSTTCGSYIPLSGKRLLQQCRLYSMLTLPTYYPYIRGENKEVNLTNYWNFWQVTHL